MALHKKLNKRYPYLSSLPVGQKEDAKIITSSEMPTEGIETGDYWFHVEEIEGKLYLTVKQKFTCGWNAVLPRTQTEGLKQFFEYYTIINNNNGVKIITSQIEPEGMEIGDYWFEVKPTPTGDYITNIKQFTSSGWHNYSIDQPASKRNKNLIDEVERGAAITEMGNTENDTVTLVRLSFSDELRLININQSTELIFNTVVFQNMTGHPIKLTWRVPGDKRLILPESDRIVTVNPDGRFMEVSYYNLYNNIYLAKCREALPNILT